MKRLLILALLVAPGLALAQPYDYHRYDGTGAASSYFCGPFTDTGNHQTNNEPFEDASGVVYYFPDDKWIVIDQARIGVWSSCSNDPDYDYAFNCTDNEGITRIGQTPVGATADECTAQNVPYTCCTGVDTWDCNIIGIRGENFFGGGIRFCLFSYDDLAADQDIDSYAQIQVPGDGGANCGNDFPGSGDQQGEGFVFIHDETLAVGSGGTECRHDGYFLIPDQLSGHIYKYCVPPGTGNATATCMDRFSKPSTCGGSNEIAALEYDEPNDTLYVLSDGGNSICRIADPDSMTDNYTFESGSYAFPSGYFGFEGLAISPNSVTMASDSSDGPNQYNGMWDLEDLMCGNEHISSVEVCDGSQLGGADCTTCSASNAVEDDCTDENIPYDCCLAADSWNCADTACATLGVTGAGLACAAGCTVFDVGACTPYSTGQTCPNNIQEGTEICDGTDLNGYTCATAVGPGYTGTPTCNGTCDGFDQPGGCSQGFHEFTRPAEHTYVDDVDPFANNMSGGTYYQPDNVFIFCTDDDIDSEGNGMELGAIDMYGNLIGDVVSAPARGCGGAGVDCEGVTIYGGNIYCMGESGVGLGRIAKYDLEAWRNGGSYDGTLGDYTEMWTGTTAPNDLTCYIPHSGGSGPEGITTIPYDCGAYDCEGGGIAFIVGTQWGDSLTAFMLNNNDAASPNFQRLAGPAVTTTCPANQKSALNTAAISKPVGCTYPTGKTQGLGWEGTLKQIYQSADGQGYCAYTPARCDDDPSVTCFSDSDCTGTCLPPLLVGTQQWMNRYCDGDGALCWVDADCVGHGGTETCFTRTGSYEAYAVCDDPTLCGRSAFGIDGNGNIEVYESDSPPATYCGDEIKNGSEGCDYNDFGSSTCETEMGAGWTGTLDCTTLCTNDTSACSPPAGGRRRGGLVVTG